MQFLSTVFAIILLALVFAAMSVTRECRWAVAANCRRMNGTWSRNRIRREWVAFRDYLGNLAVPLALSIPAGFLAGQYVMENVMPINQIVTAFGEFSTDSAEWKNRLKPVRQEHEKWLEANDIADGAAIQNLQRTLWYGWPFFVVMAVAVGIFCGWSMLGMSRSAVSDYVSGVRTRRVGYSQLDVSRMMLPASMGTEIQGHSDLKAGEGLPVE